MAAAAETVHLRRGPALPGPRRTGGRAAVSTYLSAARLPVDELQQAVADHTPLAHTGRCPRCRVESPCGPLASVLRTLAAARLLPRRRPGATKPERTGARRIA